MSFQAFSLPAPAKLNLFLHIVGRREDGYHLLQTLFTFLEAGDTLSFRPHDKLVLLNPGDSPAGNDNLVLQAARLLQQHSGCRQGALLRLDKRLPLGGGLGGGSSNAATCLLGLNHLWQLGLSLHELAELGLQLGADVPVFVQGNSAFAEGVGERLTPVKLPEQDYVVIHPGVAVSTAQIFHDPELTRNQPDRDVADFLADADSPLFGNVCEALVCRHYPVIADTLEWLQKHAGNSRLTGTGACVFARVDNPHEGERIVSRLPAGWQGMVTRGSQQSPLKAALKTLS